MITANYSAAYGLTDRQSLRKLMLAKRQQVQSEQPALVDQLRLNLREWLAEHDFETVGFYRPIRAEPDLTEVFLRWQAERSGRRLCVPIVDDAATASMHYSVWQVGRGRSGMYGIEEPKTDVPIDPDVIFSPCVGVTREGFRLGNGGGFFDRWMTAQRRQGRPFVSVAVAFDCLMTDAFVPMPFDVAMDWILTESGIRPSRKKRAAI